MQGYRPYNGCTASPDYVFKSACDGHDICYGTCLTSKQTCDNNFYWGMIALCDANYRGWTAYLNPVCRARAWAYWGVVTGVGCWFYDGAQAKSCWCRNYG